MNNSNLIELNKETILVSSYIKTFEKPDYIYIPLSSQATKWKKINDKIAVGSIVVSEKNKNYFSPISGVIKDIKKMVSLANTDDFIEIKNDFTEKKSFDPKEKRCIKDITKKEFEEKITCELAEIFNSKSTLILNCLDDEPYVLNENFYLFLYYDGFLELLDTMAHIYNFNEIVICVKSTSGENINKLINTLGSFPNIKLNICPNLYLLGKNNFLLKHLEKSEEESAIIKANEFFKIYNIIKKNRITTSKLITISGNAIENPSIVDVKIGTKIEDIVNNLIIIKEEPVVYIINGLMQGKIIDIKDFIITNEVESLLIMKEILANKEEKCMNCGACLNICPVKINPLMLNNKKYWDKVKDVCIKCNLCSYICPSNINFNKYISKESQNE